MFTYPLECFVCRDVIENTFFSKYKGNLVLHVTITAVIVFTTVLLSLATDCLGIVLELNVSFRLYKCFNLVLLFFKGSLIATLLAYVMPALCAILINKRYKNNKMSLIVPVIVCLFGLFVATYGLISIISKFINGYSCSHGLEPVYCKHKNIYSSFSNITSLFNHTNQV
jgi:sodium-coupled neutral amino acid transporter 11